MLSDGYYAHDLKDYTSIPSVYCTKCGRELRGSYIMTQDGLILCSLCQGENQLMKGWICPRCGTVHSPYSMKCDCKEPGKSNLRPMGFDVY